MKILVTGGNGLIGKAFVKAQKKTFDIVAPTSEQMDIFDARSVDEVFSNNKFDAVLHLAGLVTSNKVAPQEDDALIMFTNIQHAAARHGVKKLIVLCDGPADAGWGKKLTGTLAAKDKITTVLRVFGVYGSGGTRPVTKIVAAASHGKKQIVIDRDRVISAVSVEDAVKVIALLLKKDAPKGDYNLVSGDTMSYLEIAKAMRRLVRKDGFDLEIVVKNDAPDSDYTASNEALLAVLPYKFTSISAGVKKLYNDLKD